MARAEELMLARKVDGIIRIRHSVELQHVLLALELAGIPSTLAGDGSVRTDADPARVGAVALTAGIALTELRSAEGAGLEDMFLSLTADTQREGVAA